MVVEKVINNNLVRSTDDSGSEVLVMGCGLGFKKNIGDKIDEEKIEKIYAMSNSKQVNHLELLISKIPLEHIQIANEIIDYAKISLQKKLNENIYITLTDHIHFAIERYQQGLPIENALLWEIKRFYNHEYLIGKEALKMIENRINISLPEDEAGFIAFHLVNATMDAMDFSKAHETMKIISNILNIVKYHYNIELNQNSLNYERFITHLKFFVQRVFSGVVNDQQNDNFFMMIKQQYKDAYLCVLKVFDYMQKEYQITPTNEEMIFLTIHIHRVTTE